MSTDLQATAESIRPSEQVRELATITPGASTDELLHKLLADLAALLGAKRAYVTETLRGGVSRTIASWEDGQRGPPLKFLMKGTPCASVMKHGVQVIDCELGSRYRLGKSSVARGCESFLGSPIVDHKGNKVGQLCVFGARPLHDAEMASALVSLAAVRVSAELEHKQHEKSLREQRRKLEFTLGNLPGMAYRCDYDERRRIRFASQGCEALTGYPSQELIASEILWRTLTFKEDQARVWNEVRDAVSAGNSYEIQYRICTRDGALKWVWERGSGLLDDGGQVCCLEGFISDATALKESQMALARSEAYSKAIVATAAEGIITLDAKGKIESINSAAERMFGYESGELIGQPVNRLMPEPYRSAHDDYVDRYVSTGEGNIIGTGREVPARRKDGSEFPIHLAASEVMLDGEPCFAGIIRDISDQKAAEESLSAVERRFRAVFDQRLHLVGILSTEGVVLEANQKSLDFGGLTRDSVIGKKYWDAPWWSHSPALQERMRDAVDSAARGETVRLEVSCPNAEGDLATLDFSMRPIKDAAGDVVFLVTESQDITEQKHAEEEARQHRARIAHVSRLSTLGEMAAGIAHEINQPLTAISLFAQAGRRLVESGNFEKMDEVCYKLNEHALRASEVVERMQSMARQGESVKETLACNDLIQTAVRLAESEARIYDVQIDFDKGEDLLPVLVDGVQIQQVALNLLRNGMEAMLTADCCQSKTIKIRTRRLDTDEVEVSVTDCGSGVLDENVGKLFTPFSTTKKSGMGMGLSISQAIIRAHGGQIDFRNNTTGGATFWFTLPAAKREIHDGR